MDDRTTTAYSASTHHFVPNPAAGRQQPMLRMAPRSSAPAPANARSDEAELMWLDDADLLSVSDSFTAVDNSKSSIFAKCVVPGLGLFAAVLFGHLILAASGQVMPAVDKHAASAPPPAAASATPPAAPSGTAAAPSNRTLQPPGSATQSATPPAVESGEPVAAAGSAPQRAIQPSPDTDTQSASPTPPEKGSRSHRQHYDDGAHGSGAGEPSAASDKEPAAAVVPSQSGLLRVNSRPWAQVTLDGNPLGNTPLFDVQVVPGAHTLLLSNPDFQVSKTIQVDVAPGETVTRVVSLQE